MKIGDTAIWLTLSGAWFYGRIIGLRGDYAIIRRTSPSGAICEVHLSRLS